MGHMTTYLFLMFAISFALFLGGFPPAFLALESEIGTTPNLLAILLQTIKDNIVITGVSAAVVTALVATGSSLARSVAMLIIFEGIMNIFIVPRAMWESGLLPNEIKIGVIMFFNIMMFLIAMELMTERSV